MILPYFMFLAQDAIYRTKNRTFTCAVAILSGDLIASCASCSYTLSADEIPSGVKQFYHTNQCRGMLTVLNVDGGVVHRSTYLVQRVQQAHDTEGVKQGIVTTSETEVFKT
jgi:hypothetical protein